MNQSIQNVFNAIPVNEILQIASSIQSRLIDEKSLIKEKGGNELVTEADLKIQECLLDYFSGSELGGTYFLKAEEELGAKELLQNESGKLYQLIIDPLDGTNPFSQGKNNWGVMVGVCSNEGEILFSWNLLSSGEIYSSVVPSEKPPNEKPQSWSLALKTKSRLRIDIDDYGAGAAERFPQAFSKIAGWSLDQLEVSSQAAAVVAGWELYQGVLDGLLWLPSEKGKRSYPDYDLTYLGALKNCGWKIALGKKADSVQMVVVAPSEEELSQLIKTGLSLLTPQKAEEINIISELKITTSIAG